MHHICIDVCAFRCSVFDITNFQLLNIFWNLVFSFGYMVQESDFNSARLKMAKQIFRICSKY
jgi:hypothetical protein